jgi:hypothetical protein
MTKYAQRTVWLSLVNKLMCDAPCGRPGRSGVLSGYGAPDHPARTRYAHGCADPADRAVREDLSLRCVLQPWNRFGEAGRDVEQSFSGGRYSHRWSTRCCRSAWSRSGPSPDRPDGAAICARAGPGGTDSGGTRDRVHVAWAARKRGGIIDAVVRARIITSRARPATSRATCDAPSVQWSTLQWSTPQASTL